MDYSSMVESIGEVWLFNYNETTLMRLSDIKKFKIETLTHADQIQGYVRALFEDTSTEEMLKIKCTAKSNDVDDLLQAKEEVLRRCRVYIRSCVKHDVSDPDEK